MIRQSIVDRLASSNVRLQVALVAGEPTTPHRTAITRLEADLIKLDVDTQQAESTAIAKAAKDQRELATSIAENAGTSIAATLARHPLPTYQPIHSETMTSPTIIHAAKALAAEETKYEKAAQIYGEAVNKTAEVQSRLSDLETAGASIREQRHSGKLADREAAGLILLNREDADDLRKLLNESMSREPTLPSFEPVLQAQAALDQAVNLATFDALAQRAKEAEQAFLALIGEAYQAGRSIGRSSLMGASWIPSKELGYLVTSGTPSGQR